MKAFCITVVSAQKLKQKSLGLKRLNNDDDDDEVELCESRGGRLPDDRKIWP